MFDLILSVIVQVLVYGHHSIRKAWNDVCLKRHCKQKNVYRYIVPAENMLKDEGEPPLLVRLKIAEAKDKTTGDHIEIAEGMKAMVLLNLAMEADIARCQRNDCNSQKHHPRPSRTNKTWSNSGGRNPSKISSSSHFV